jgi:molecular chaperone DnaK (HSP70)
MYLGHTIRTDSGARVCLDLGTAFSKACAYLGEGGVAATEIAPLPIGTSAQAEHALLTPSAMYVDDGRILFGPAALERARAGVKSKRNPIVSFKMVLSARDVEAALALKLSRSVDPTSTLRHRDALVLYLAYLDQLIRAAVAAEPTLPPTLADAPRRLTSPDWRAPRETERVVGDLADQSAMVSARLGRSLLNPFGVTLAEAHEALHDAQTARPVGLFEGIVFEAHSAASAYATFACAPARYVLILDMGAGTTDLVGFERDMESVSSPAFTEIGETRQCSLLAGDEIDNILIDIFLRASGNRGRDAQDELWRALRLSAADLKRDLFQRGKATMKYEKRQITVTRDKLMKAPAFKAFCRGLEETIVTSLRPIAAKAKRAGVSEIAVLLAGGGSNLPFLAELIRKVRIPGAKGVKLKVDRFFGSNWTLPHRHHPLGGMFPQMAIAMGGALAPLVEERAVAPQTA